ncbi:MAG: hypothetical protein ACPGN3_12120 [Opitutales bacterium]
MPGVKTKAPEPQHVYSPSGIEFHNALRLEEGSLGFIEIEFAGWDDGAGLLADFIYQPQVAEENHPFRANPLEIYSMFS